MNELLVYKDGSMEVEDRTRDERRFFVRAVLFSILAGSAFALATTEQAPEATTIIADH